jgi:hypothetical protein
MADAPHTEMRVEVGTLLDDIRGQYVSQFLAALSEAESEPDATVVSEGDLVDKDGELVTEGLLDVGVRADIVVISTSGTRSIQVDSPRTISFAPVDFQWGRRLGVRLQPFHWDYCELSVFPPLKAAGAHPLAKWFRHWFEPRELDGRMLGVPHFISDPEPSGARERYFIDLGTAPVEAFEQLLDACLLAGATDVVVGSAPT